MNKKWTVCITLHELKQGIHQDVLTVNGFAGHVVPFAKICRGFRFTRFTGIGQGIAGQGNYLAIGM